MARPIINRTIETYERDIAALKRLRTAIRQDASLDSGRANEAVADIMRCVASLERLVHGLRRIAA